MKSRVKITINKHVADVRLNRPDKMNAIDRAMFEAIIDVLRELTYTNREFSGVEAQALGFATCVDGEPLQRAQEIAAQIALKHPAAIREAKALCNTVPDLDEDAILMAESVAQEKVIRTPDQVEAVMAAIQKRVPQFSE